MIPATEHPIEVILKRVSEMTNAERSVAQYIVSNQGTVIYLTAKDLAERIGVSDATVVRFCQSLGYSGFKELKLKIAIAAQASESFAEQADSAIPIKRRFETVFERTITTIRNTQARLSTEALTKVAARLLGAKRVYLLGAGTSAVVARDAQIKLTRLGITALQDEQPHNMAAALALCGVEDVVLAFSHSGNTAEIVHLSHIAKSKGAWVTIVTNNASSRVVEIANELLITGSDELPFHSFAMTSRLAQLVVVDCLVTIMIAELGEVQHERQIAITEAVTELMNNSES